MYRKKYMKAFAFHKNVEDFYFFLLPCNTSNLSYINIFTYNIHAKNEWMNKSIKVRSTEIF